MGYLLADLAKLLGMTGQGVGYAVGRGEQIAKVNNYQTILPFFFGHFFGTLAGHFLRFVLVVKSEDQASITPP